MLSLYETLKSGKAGASADFFTAAAGRAMFSSGFDKTEESDFILSGKQIIYYRGSGRKPTASPMPVIAQGAFAGQSIKAVKIQEGTEEIE